MTPSCVLRAARFAAACRPFFRKKSMASSMALSEAVKASLQSIIPAPVFSRRSLIIAGVICMGRFLPPALFGGEALCGLGLSHRDRWRCGDVLCHRYGSLTGLRLAYTLRGRLVHVYGGFRRRPSAVEICGLPLMHPFNDRIRKPCGDQTNRPNGVVVTRNDVVNIVWITVRINDGYRRDTQFLGLADGDLFFL